MVIDGPTFVASEGWDWIPAIRDRDSGIWQPVHLVASGAVKIGDPNIVTMLPLPDRSSAKINITVPLMNASSETATGTLTASFEGGVSIKKEVKLAPGENSVELTPEEFAGLNVQQPRLWWPNGYGKPELYHLKLAFETGGAASDTKTVQFGMREVTYEVSLLDNSGHLRRVEYMPTLARNTKASVVQCEPMTACVRFREDGCRRWRRELTTPRRSRPTATWVQRPYFILKVNGVRIAARGGNWGMDDSRKRVSMERLEPYFRLHRDANVNIIRKLGGSEYRVGVLRSCG